MSNESASPDPKTVCFDIKDRVFLTFDQGTPYFMPFEIHSGEKIISPASTRPLSDDEFIKFWSGLSQLPGMPKAILRYAPNHDQESLMWVTLWIVYGLVHWEGAEKIRSQIFANTHFPTREREHFFKIGDPQKGNLCEAFHPCREIIFSLWNDIELSWKLHLVKYLFQIFTYKYGIVVTF